MSLPANLTTNEVKDHAGTEVEYNRISTLDRSVTFAKNGELPYLPTRLKVSHQEIGSGSNLRRRSVVRFDDTVINSVDGVTPVTVSAYAVLDIPVGALADLTKPQDTMAKLMSFLASLGASTTILYDGTGNGAAALLNGSL